MTATFRFDPEAHRYFINDRPVPHFTQVARDLLPGWQASEWYLQRGKAIHACAAMIGKGLPFDYDPQIDGYVKAILLFFRECDIETIICEWPVYSVRNQYAGTLDAVVQMPDSRLCIIDYKSTLGPTVPLQLAAYALAEGEMRGKAPYHLGFGVELHSDGTYKLSEVYDLRKYYGQWLHLLGAFNVRRECGIKQQEVENGNGTGQD